MLKLNRSTYELIPDELFPVYWKATDEQIRSALFDSDAWSNDPDADSYYYILTFDDIADEFNSWTPETRSEYLQDSDTPDYTVYDWIRDCMMNSLSVIKGFRKIEQEYDDPFEIVMDMTDGDPLADLTLEDAAHLIGEAEARGYSVPDDLTPETFLAIYEDMKNTEEE